MHEMFLFVVNPHIVYDSGRGNHPSYVFTEKRKILKLCMPDCELRKALAPPDRRDLTLWCYKSTALYEEQNAAVTSTLISNYDHDLISVLYPNPHVNSIL